MLKVLYDGWLLVSEPNSPAARHLLTILASISEDVEAVVALPGGDPQWIPQGVDTQILSSDQRMRWEQGILPRAARKIGADILHSLSLSAPLFSSVPVVASPAEYRAGPLRASGFIDRWRSALGQGGLARGAYILWPSDLPQHERARMSLAVPPVVHPGYTPIPFGDQEAPHIPGVEIPETYALYHGPGSRKALNELLQAWTWAAGPVGEYYPLLLLGLGSEGTHEAQKWIAEYGLETSVRILPLIEPAAIKDLYQNSSALFHPAGISPWGGAVRHALACGLPVVAWQNAASHALAGPAAYLVEAGDVRNFGAAMISVLVQEQLQESLSELSRERSRRWTGNGFKERLLEIYREVAG